MGKFLVVKQDSLAAEDEKFLCSKVELRIRSFRALKGHFTLQQ